MTDMYTLRGAQLRDMVTDIHGNGTNVGMTVEITNNTHSPLHIRSDLGTVIASSAPEVQTMVVAREKTYMAPPMTKVQLAIDALCLEATKAPPFPTDAGTHTIQGISRDIPVMQLLRTTAKTEREIACHVTDIDEAQGTFRHTLQDEDLIEMARMSKHVPTAQGTIATEISPSVIQVALWESTDKLDMVDYARVVGELVPHKETADMAQSLTRLSANTRCAELLLKRAGIEPTIKTPHTRYEQLLALRDLMQQRLFELEKAKIIETDAAVIFKLKVLIDQAKEELRLLEERINATHM